MLWHAAQAAQMSTPARPRFTPQLLNMRRIERNLAEQRSFTKANKVGPLADAYTLFLQLTARPSCTPVYRNTVRTADTPGRM